MKALILSKSQAEQVMSAMAAMNVYSTPYMKFQMFVPRVGGTKAGQYEAVITIVWDETRPQQMGVHYREYESEAAAWMAVHKHLTGRHEGMTFWDSETYASQNDFAAAHGLD